MCFEKAEYSLYNVVREYGSIVRKLKTLSERYPGPANRQFDPDEAAETERRRTTPRRTRKDNTVGSQVLKLVLQNLKTITLKPGDLILNSIDFSIVFGASQDSRVLLNGIDSFPFPSQGKSNSVPTSSRKCVDENTASGWRRLGNLLCYFTVIFVSALVQRQNRGKRTWQPVLE